MCAHLTKVNINSILEEFRSFHASFLYCKHSHRLHTSFQFNNTCVFILEEIDNGLKYWSTVYFLITLYSVFLYKNPSLFGIIDQAILFYNSVCLYFAEMQSGLKHSITNQIIRLHLWIHGEPQMVFFIPFE